EDIPNRRANVSFFEEFRPAGLTPVTAFPEGRSSAGIYDLIGNVSEWCYPGSTPMLATDQAIGVLRGGCSWHTPAVVDATFRDEVNLNVRDNQTGIRLVRRGTVTSGVANARLLLVNTGAKKRRPIPRPTRPFRQEGIPIDLSEASWR